MSQKARTIELLRKGWLTALQSAQRGGCLSLSQRVGELRKAGYTIADCWVDMDSGARVKAYRLLKEPAKAVKVQRARLTSPFFIF